MVDGQWSAAATTDPLPANVYTVKTTLAANDYYTAPEAVSQLAVYDPAGGFVTGGGFLCNGGLKTFGFCLKPSSSDPWLPKGNVTLIDHSDPCKPLVVKATGFAWLVIPTDEDIAYAAGTCTLGGVTGYTFSLTVEDLGGWLVRLDTIHLKVVDAAGVVAFEAQGIIGGGNIAIHR